MAKILSLFLPVFAFVLLTSTAVLAQKTAPAQPGSSSLFVEIQQSKLRSEPKHFSKSLLDLQYGDRLELVEDQGDWKRVRFSHQVGYVHDSAVTKKVVVLRHKGAPVQSDVQEGEIVLAGKGFNKDIEDEYEKSDSEANYEAVDELESVRIGSEAMLRFQEGSRSAK